MPDLNGASYQRWVPKGEALQWQRASDDSFGREEMPPFWFRLRRNAARADKIAELPRRIPTVSDEKAVNLISKIILRVRRLHGESEGSDELKRNAKLGSLIDFRLSTSHFMNEMRGT